jgi:cytochrome P450
VSLGDEHGAVDSFARLQREFGDCVGLSAGPNSVVLIYRPDQAREIFKERRAIYGRGGPLQREAYPLLGESLILNDDPISRRVDRADFTKALNAASVACFAPGGSADELVTQTLDRWEPAARAAGSAGIEIADDLQSLSFAIAGRALLGADIAEHEAALTTDTHAFWKHAMGRAALPVKLPRWVPTPAALRSRRFVRRAHAAVDAILERVLQGECDDSPMAGLVAASGSMPNSRETLRLRLLTLLLASHETVYAMLCYTLYLLALNPDVQDELVEGHSGFGNTSTPPGAEPDYVTMVLRESLRLYPPAPAIVRAALEEDQLEGYRIPKNTILFYPIWATHRDPRYWDEPEAFRPERFGKQAALEIEEFAYFPFARGGARSCVGERFAMLEGELVISRIIERFAPATVSGHVLRTKLVLNMVPSEGLRLRLDPR